MLPQGRPGISFVEILHKLAFHGFDHRLSSDCHSCFGESGGGDVVEWGNLSLCTSSRKWALFIPSIMSLFKHCVCLWWASTVPILCAIRSPRFQFRGLGFQLSRRGLNGGTSRVPEVSCFLHHHGFSCRLSQRSGVTFGPDTGSFWFWYRVTRNAYGISLGTYPHCFQTPCMFSPVEVVKGLCKSPDWILACYFPFSCGSVTAAECVLEPDDQAVLNRT